jgi:hypothetical protein
MQIAAVLQYLSEKSILSIANKKRPQEQTLLMNVEESQ